MCSAVKRSVRKLNLSHQQLKGGEADDTVIITLQITQKYSIDWTHLSEVGLL